MDGALEEESRDQTRDRTKRDRGGISSARDFPRRGFAYDRREKTLIIRLAGEL
jgi:hypothetical protein